MDMDKLKSRLMLSYNIFKIVPLLGILIALYVMKQEPYRRIYNRNSVHSRRLRSGADILPLPLLRSAANEGPRRRTTPLSRV